MIDLRSMCLIEHLFECHVIVVQVRSRGRVGERGAGEFRSSWKSWALGSQPVGKERTSLVSTPPLAELYSFAMNFLLVRKRKRKRNRDGRKRGK